MRPYWTVLSALPGTVSPAGPAAAGKPVLFTPQSAAAGHIIITARAAAAPQGLSRHPAAHSLNSLSAAAVPVARTAAPPSQALRLSPPGPSPEQDRGRRRYLRPRQSPGPGPPGRQQAQAPRRLAVAAAGIGPSEPGGPHCPGIRPSRHWRSLTECMGSALRLSASCTPLGNMSVETEPHYQLHKGSRATAASPGGRKGHRLGWKPLLISCRTRTTPS